MHHRRWNRKGIDTIIAALLLVVIVVVMSVLIYTWSTGVFGSILPAPTNGKEVLVFENAAYNTANNNVTVYLRNTGTAVTTLTSYYVADLNGNECAKTTGWAKGPYSPTQLAQVPLSLTSCTWTGTPFTFTPGNTYTVTVVTSHNSQFVFTIQR